VSDDFCENEVSLSNWGAVSELGLDVESHLFVRWWFASLAELLSSLEE